MNIDLFSGILKHYLKSGNTFRVYGTKNIYVTILVFDSPNVHLLVKRDNTNLVGHMPFHLESFVESIDSKILRDNTSLDISEYVHWKNDVNAGSFAEKIKTVLAKIGLIGKDDDNNDEKDNLVDEKKKKEKKWGSR